MTLAQWETLLFFSSIFFTLASVALVFGFGASVVLFDIHPIEYAALVWVIASICVVVCGARVEG